MTDETDKDGTPDTAQRLQEELGALLRQRDQYGLAMDAATDPKISIRLQRTLERLEEEIAGLEDALRAIPGSSDATPVAAAAQEEPPAPPEPEPEPEPAPEPAADVTMAPDWDEEPATSIYDPATFAELTKAAEAKEAEEAAAAAAEEPAPPATDEPVAAAPEPEEQAAAPEVDEALAAEAEDDQPTEEELRRQRAAAENAAALGRLRQPEPQQSDPLGPVILDALEPPTGELRKPAPETSPGNDDGTAVGAPEDPPAEAPAQTPSPADPDEEAPTLTVDAAPPIQAAAAAADLGDDDPFAMPGQASSMAMESDSVFGGPPAASTTGFDTVSVLDDEGSEWSGASKFLLALVIAGFLGGVFYILMQ